MGFIIKRYDGNLDAEKRRLGNWARSGSMTNNYESILPREAMHNIAGSTKTDLYKIGRSKVIPPIDLDDMVFPTLNYLLNADEFYLLIRVVDDIEYSESVKGFVKIMKLLRVVFLQDACIMIDKYPTNQIST